LAKATGKPSDIAAAQNAQNIADQVAKAAKKADADAKKATMLAQKADATASDAEKVAKLADLGNGPPMPQGGVGMGGGGGGGVNVNVNVGGGSPDGGGQVVGLGGGPVLFPQPIVVPMPDALPPPVVPYPPQPSYYQPSYGPGGASGKSSRRLTAIALGWNLDGAWVVRKNPNVDAATRDAVSQCNTQFGTCTLSDAMVTPTSFGCLAVGRGNDNASRLFAAARGSMDDARSAVMDQMTTSGSAGDILYVDCNGG
jgi:hypothetical protein